MYRCKQKIVLSLLLFSILFLINFSYFYLRYNKSGSQFDGFNNINGSSVAIIPNIVHYVLLGTDSFNFIAFLSMVSVLKIQNPDSILIHSDTENLTGHYWDLIRQLAESKKTKIELMPIKRPTHVFGQPLSSIYHITDVARIVVLMSFGGIYLDTDTLILRSLDKFLKYEMVVGWPQKENIGTQILIGHKDARFLKLWLDGYRRYQPRNWYYNAGQYPVELLSKNPELARREDTLLGVQNLIKNLYEDKEWNGWKSYYSVHLLSRHHSEPLKLNENSVSSYKHSFGEIASWLLFKVQPPLVVNGSKHWKF